MPNNSNDKKKRGVREYLTQDFVIEIKANALSSLKHGVEHFTYKETDDNLKFATLHIFHALELFLKARLAEEHPLLIYNKPEDGEININISTNASTVNFKTLMSRLKKANVKIEKEEEESLAYLQDARNCIEHHQITAGKKEVKEDIGRAAKFLDKFLKDELDMNLKEKIGDTLYEILQSAIYSYEERLKEARKRLEKFLEQNKDDYIAECCPECHNDTLAYSKYSSLLRTAKCFFCEEKFDEKECGRCGQTILYSGLNPIHCCDRCGSEL